MIVAFEFTPIHKYTVWINCDEGTPYFGMEYYVAYVKDGIVCYYQSGRDTYSPEYIFRQVAVPEKEWNKRYGNFEKLGGDWDSLVIRNL